MKQIFIFISKCLLVCAGALLLLLILNYRYEQVRENPYADADKFNYMNSTYTDIQICNIGSSHGEYAFYYDTLSKMQGYECFNFAMASQTYDYDYAILSMYQKHFSEQCFMFIPVSYFSFNNEVTDENEQQFLSSKYYTFLSPKYIPSYNPYVDLITHYFPILSAGEDMGKLFPSLSLSVLAAQKTDEAADPAKESQFREKALNRYHRHMDGKENYFLPERIDNLYAILDFCKQNDITAVLITTPYTGYYSSLFSPEFKAGFSGIVDSIARDTGVPYYDYSADPRFSNSLEYFSDADHLNTEGAALFTGIIEKEIPEFQEFLSNVAPNGKELVPGWKPSF